MRSMELFVLDSTMAMLKFFSLLYLCRNNGEKNKGKKVLSKCLIENVHQTNESQKKNERKRIVEFNNIK